MFVVLINTKRLDNQSLNGTHSKTGKELSDFIALMDGKHTHFVSRKEHFINSFKAIINV